MNFNHIKYILTLILLITLTACFGRGSDKQQTSAENQPQVDMTRPPNAIADREDREEEGNPDETISYEEWKKKQESDE